MNKSQYLNHFTGKGGQHFLSQLSVPSHCRSCSRSMSPKQELVVRAMLNLAKLARTALA